jgi:glycerol-3-phosphate dehydrogenase
LFGSVPQNRSVLEFDAYVQDLQRQYDWLSPGLVRRYARAYGSRTHTLLNDRKSLTDMGAALAKGLYPAELEYLMDVEWASTSTDILWRRSKLGLHLPPETAQKIDAWIAARR